MRQALKQQQQRVCPQKEDEDVAAESAAVQQLCQEYCSGAGDGDRGEMQVVAVPPGLHLFGLRKVYPAPTSWSSIFSSCFKPSQSKLEPRALNAALPAAGDAPNTPAAAVMEPSCDAAGPVEDAGSTRGATAGHVAVAGSWLSIPAGQCFCLLGPNGAGKTTSIRCLIGVRSRLW